MPLTELLHITAAYSNAVLVAILPHVNDFVKKAELSVPIPITANQIARFNVSRMQGSVGGGLWLTNGCVFAFNNGCVYDFTQHRNNPWRSDDPAQDWPHYVGKENMNTNEAIALARAELVKLGYNPAMLHADIPPASVEGSYEMKQGHFPYCQIKWNKEAATVEEQADAAYVKFQINLADKSILEYP